jgi:branched-chain amino acid transport system substrate-binding protein
MNRLVILVAAIAFGCDAQAQAPVRIGVAAPLSGPSAELGAQIVAGARASAAAGGAATIEADTGCSADGGREAARRFAQARVAVAVGFLCTEALEAALPVLRQAGIPTIDVGVRADRFTAKRAKTGDLVWRVAPRADAEASALAKLVAARWRDTAFGILDDGSPYGRALADAVRTKLEDDGIKPTALDTYRPAEEKQFAIARRILRTGVTHFAIAGERGDAATIARDAAATGVPLQLIGGEALLDEPSDAAELPAGTLAVGVRNRFPGIGRSAGDAAPQRRGYFGPAYAAAEIAADAARLATEGTRPVAAVLNESEFDTSLGRVRFDANGDSNLDLFEVLRFGGRDFAPDAGG